MDPERHTRESAAERFPAGALALGVLASCAFVGFVTWNTWASFGMFERASTDGVQLQQLMGRILRLDEVLTMSARMAAATGETRWEERYRAHEPLLDEAIQRAIELAPGLASPKATDEANRILVALENEAFALVAEGRASDALARLESPEYEDNKRIYAAGVRHMTTALEAHNRQALEDSSDQAVTTTVLAAASALALLAAWIGIAHRIRVHLAARRRLDARIREGARLESLGILAAGIAHEINNPLAFVHASVRHLEQFVDSLADRDKPDEWQEARDAAADGLEGLARIAGIVERTRQLTRGSAEEAPFAVADVLTQAIRMMAARPLPGIEVECLPLPPLPRVHGSAHQIEQVVTNLIDNGRQAARESAGTRVQVEASAAGPWVEIRVHDDGGGVPEAIRERLFDPFFTTKSPHQGTGLGLAIAYDTVRRHGGRLEVRDSPLGGACFVVTLPEFRELG